MLDFSPLQSPKNLVCGYALHTGKFLRVRKVFARMEKIGYKMKPELLSAIKFSRLSGNLPDYLETFRTVRKFSGSSGKYPAYPENFQTIRKKSTLSGNFSKGPETSQCNFKGYAQILSGRAKTFRMAMPPCHPGFWASEFDTPTRHWIDQLYM